MAELRDIDGTVVRRRWFAYVAMFAFLFFAYLYLRDSTWRGGIELHTLMETVATILALTVGCLALVRFYSRKDNKFLFIGTGFISTAFLDGYHTVVSSSHFIESFPSFSSSHIAWSWFASRIFLAVLLWLSWLFWRREDRLGAAGRVSEKLVYGTVSALALALFSIVEFVPLPTTYYRQLPIPRPQEFVPALFFLLALIGYLHKGKWKTNMFEHWLVLSLIAGFMGQAMFMSLSGRLYDMMFDAAHLLKAGSYLCAMVGLLFSMQRLFSESIAQQELAFTNTILTTQQEVSPDAILVVDEREKIISYNRRFADLWGLPQEMVAARVDAPVLQSVAAQVQDIDTFLTRVNHLYEHRSEESHEEIALKDGRIIDRYSAPVIGENGRYYGRIWFFRDITERRHTEQTVMNERIFSDTLITSLPDLFFVIDSTGRFIRWNDKLRDVRGYSDTQIAATNALETVHEADRPLVAQKMQEAFQQGAATIVARLVTRTGIRDYNFKATRADTAKGAYLIGVGTDITERKQAEQSAIDERVFSDTLIKSQPDVFYVLDSTGRFIRWNDKLGDVLGHSDTQIAATNALDVIHGADRPVVAQKIQEAFEQGAATIVARLVTKTGIRDYSLKATRADTAKGEYLIGVGTDITERKHAEEMLQRSDAHLAEAQHISHVGSWELDHVTNEGRWSAEAFRIFEHDPASVIPSFDAFLDTVHPDDRDMLKDTFGRSLQEHTPYEIEHRLLMKDGRIKYVREQCQTSFDELGRPLLTVGTVQDITDRVLSERQIKLFRSLLDGAPDEIQVLDPATLRIIDVNESACIKLGYTRKELLAMRVPDIDTADPESHRAIGERLLKDSATTFETYHKRKDGTVFPVEITIRTITLDHPYALAIARDITERKLAEAEVQKLHEQLREQALHDPLTGLYNRRYLDEAMGRELIRSARNKQPIGIVMCDLDHFKLVNDTYGHLVGDEVLRVFAELLKKNSRGSDIVCRFGGEEFLLLLPDMPPDVAYQRAEKLRTALAVKQITSGTTVIQVTASFGVAVFPENGKTQDALIHAADVAMYQAKEAGRNRVVISTVRGEDVPERMGTGSAVVSK